MKKIVFLLIFCSFFPPISSAEIMPGHKCNISNAKECSSGSFCKYPEGTCEKNSAKGTCTIIPEICMSIYMPVCGCDGKTYQNACKAFAEGVSIAHKGQCK